MSARKYEKQLDMFIVYRAKKLYLVCPDFFPASKSWFFAYVE
jgi:hypothetical protein